MLLALWLQTASAQEGATSLPPGITVQAPDYYVIQEGDTLWDISTRFLADPYDWPELWSINEYITNPHWIYPGNKIYFRLGDALNPPSVSVISGAVTQVEDTPPPVVQSESEVACDFPPRFEGVQEGVRVTAPGVLADDDALNIRGKVYGSDQVGTLLGEGAILYLEMDDAEDLECGQLVGLFRRQKGRQVRGPDGPLGRVYYVLGEGTVLRVDDDIVTVRIRDGWFDVQRGDLVGDPIPVDLEVDVRRPHGDLAANIVARLHSEENRLPATGETVFLDRGSNDGVDVGTAFYVVESRDGERFDAKEDMRLPDAVVGRVVVVRSEPAFATGVVVDAARDIQVGARLLTAPNPE